MDNPFVIYETNTVEPKLYIDLPLYEPIDITDWASTTPSGLVIVKNNLPRMIQSSSETKQPSSEVQPSSNEDMSNVSFEDLIKQENLPIRITSGFRGAGSLRGGKTALGRRSNHNRTDAHGHPMAYDIAPTSGHSFDDLRKIMYKNPRVVNWFKQRGWGILEEMLDGKRGFYDTEGKFHYTGATGPHFHIGPDTHAVRNYSSKVSKGLQGLKFNNPFITYETVQTPDVKLNLPLMEDIDISDWASGFSLSGTPIVLNNLPQMIQDRQEIEIALPTSNSQTYNLSDAGYSNAGSYRGYHVPSGSTQVNITKDLLGKDKDTGELFKLNPSSLLGNSTILNSSASKKGNNPLSISHSSSDLGFKGAFKVKDGLSFSSYESVVDGLASAMRLYKRKYNNRSVRGINDGYQGSYEATKNDKALTNLRLIWITNISKLLGIDPTKRLNLDDKETMFSLMAAIAKQESNSTLGRQDLEAAWKKAFG